MPLVPGTRETIRKNSRCFASKIGHLQMPSIPLVPGASGGARKNGRRFGTQHGHLGMPSIPLVPGARSGTRKNGRCFGTQRGNLSTPTTPLVYRLAFRAAGRRESRQNGAKMARGLGLRISPLDPFVEPLPLAELKQTGAPRTEGTLPPAVFSPPVECAEHRPSLRRKKTCHFALPAAIVQK